MSVFGWVTGNISFNIRPISNSACDLPKPSGLLRNISNSFWMSCFDRSHFRINALTLSATASAKPLKRGYLGLLVVCWTPHSSMKVRSCLLKYCGPLSDTNFRYPVSRKCLFDIINNTLCGWATEQVYFWTWTEIICYNQIIGITLLKHVATHFLPWVVWHRVW